MNPSWQNVMVCLSVALTASCTEIACLVKMHVVVLTQLSGLVFVFRTLMSGWS